MYNLVHFKLKHAFCCGAHPMFHFGLGEWLMEWTVAYSFSAFLIFLITQSAFTIQVSIHSCTHSHTSARCLLCKMPSCWLGTHRHIHAGAIRGLASCPRMLPHEGLRPMGIAPPTIRLVDPPPALQPPGKLKCRVLHQQGCCRTSGFSSVVTTMDTKSSRTC